MKAIGFIREAFRKLSVDSQLGDLGAAPGFPGPDLMLRLYRGAHMQSHSPMKRKYACAIWLRTGDSSFELTGRFKTESVGMLNRSEQATLVMRDHICEFQREKRRGIWKWNGTVIGEVLLNWSMWHLYSGKVDVMRASNEPWCAITFGWRPVSDQEDMFGQFTFRDKSRLPFLAQPRLSAFSDGLLLRTRPAEDMTPLFGPDAQPIFAHLSDADRVLLFSTAIWARSLFG